MSVPRPLCLLLLVCLVAASAAALPGLFPPFHGVTGAAPPDEFDLRTASTGSSPLASQTAASSSRPGSGPSSVAKDLLPHLLHVPGERVQGPVDNC